MHQFQLDNGLTVLIKPVKNKVVTLDMWVNTGSANETAPLNGISHFLEHMMFKGTPRYGPGELDKIIMGIGGVWNAGTSKDFTHYYVTVAAPYFNTALDCISDMMLNATIDSTEFDQEKMVILEEYRRKQDDPFGMLYDELYDRFFHSGPYKQSVLGSFESISNLDRDDMEDYYRRYYTADNMAFIIVGDVDPAQIEPAIRTAFAGATPNVRPIANAPRQTSYAPGELIRIQKDVRDSYLGAAFEAPPIADEKAVVAMDIALTILGDGVSSRLNRILKEEKRLVNSISAGFATHRYPGMAYIAATLSETDPALVIHEAAAQFRQLATNVPTDAEMAKARRVIRNGMLFGMETNTGQSSTIGYYHTLTGGTGFLDRYLETVDSITAQDVIDIANQYFTRAPFAIVVEPQEKAN